TSSLQEPLYSPSVFNFFRPSYQPPGLLTQYGLVAPVFQITDSYTSIAFPNKLWEVAQSGLSYYTHYSFPPDYSELLAQANNLPQLLDEVNLLFCAGEMSAGTRAIILNCLQQM